MEKKLVMKSMQEKVIYTILSILIITFVSYKFINHNNYNNQKSELIGEPLASFDFYPIETNEVGNISLNETKINTAITSLDPERNTRAISELIHLIEENSASFLINNENSEIASSFKQDTLQYQNQNDELIEILKNIVGGIGKTLAGSPIEIVLHDTSNPLKSIIAIENPISNRKLNDKITNFGIELIKKYSKNEIKNGNIISYPITLNDGRIVKATTIPIYNNNQLVAFICINIDTSKLSHTNKLELNKTINAIKQISGKNEYIDIDELIQPIKEGSEYMEATMIRYELDKPLLIIKEKKGILACAYINVETCNKTNEACAIVSGVSNYEDMMSAKIIAVSNEALNLGVNVGDTGMSAITRFK